METEKKKRKSFAWPKTDFPKYVGEVFTQRLKDLGMTRYRFFCENVADVNRTTAHRIFRGVGTTNINVLKHYCDLLGLEIIIRPKKDNKK